MKPGAVHNGVNVGIGEFTLEGGKIVAARCERMQDVLERELDLDDGARDATWPSARHTRSASTLVLR